MANQLSEKERLRRAIRRVSKDWAAIYVREPEGPHLVRSLLLGVERGIRDRLGQLPESQRGTPHGVIFRAFWTGCDLAHQIPASTIDRLRA